MQRSSLNQPSANLQALANQRCENEQQSAPSLFGRMISRVRSTLGYDVPQTQTQELPDTDTPPSNSGPSFSERMQGYFGNLVFRPERFMAVRETEATLPLAEEDTELKAGLNYIYSWLNVLSPLTAWNLLFSLNPNYIAPRNTNLREVRLDLQAEENFSSVAHIIALICSQVSSRSTLPSEMHTILDLVSHYITRISHFKSVCDLALSIDQQAQLQAQQAQLQAQQAQLQAQQAQPQAAQEAQLQAQPARLPAIAEVDEAVEAAEAEAHNAEASNAESLPLDLAEEKAMMQRHQQAQTLAIQILQNMDQNSEHPTGTVSAELFNKVAAVLNAILTKTANSQCEGDVQVRLMIEDGELRAIVSYGDEVTEIYSFN